MSLCFATASGVKALALSVFTLVWTHSIEKVDWQEDWRVTPGGLELVQARVKGTGAGMEPPPDAVLRGGWWHYVPRLPPLPEVRLTLSPYTADYRLCWSGHCRALGQILGATGETAVVTLRACSGHEADRHRAP